MIEPPKIVSELATQVGGTITECQRLPDGSGFATMSIPLPKDHWLTKEGFSVPPMPIRMGTSERITIRIGNSRIVLNDADRQQFSELLGEAARHAIRASTMNGKEMDFDPDAMVQNMVVGLLGYWTEDGLSSDSFANPPQCQE